MPWFHKAFSMTFLAPALLLTCALAPAAQGQDSEPVPGQEVVAAAENLDVAVEGLFTYELTQPEVVDFLATIDAMEAWARANQFVWNGVFGTSGMLEGLRELPFWKEVGRDPLPFMTTLCKVYLLFLYADPYEDALQRAAWSVDNFRQRLEDPELEEKDRASMQRNLDNAIAEYEGIQSITPETRQVYEAMKEYLNPALDRWSTMGELESQAPILLTQATVGMRLRSSAGWLRDESADATTYRLPWLDAEVTLLNMPWVEGLGLEESTTGAVVAGILGGNETAEVLSIERGQDGDRESFRATYRYGDSGRQGVVYLTPVGQELHLFNFLMPARNAGLMAPIIEEMIGQLEFGTFPMPLLVDRSEMGYQVFAESPWAILDDAPEGVDLRLGYLGLDALIDITVVEAEMSPPQFEAFTDFMHDANLQEYVEPHDLGKGLGEIKGIPFGYSEVYGPRKGFPEGQEQVLHIRQVFLNLEDRLIHLNIQALESDWTSFQPLAERLFQELQFPAASTLVTYDRSHHGYRLNASSKWLETKHLDKDIEFQLVYQGPEISLGASRTRLPEEAGLPESFMKQMHEVVAGNYEDATEAVYFSGDFDGTPFGTETFHARLAGAEENGAPLRIVSFTAYFRQETDVLVFSIMTREADWEVAAPEIETLLNSLSFVPATAD